MCIDTVQLHIQVVIDFEYNTGDAIDQIQNNDYNKCIYMPQIKALTKHKYVILLNFDRK